MAMVKGFIIITVLVLFLVMSPWIQSTRVLSESGISVEGDFDVEEPPEAYGASVVGSYFTLFPNSALGAPDQRGAVLYQHGWITLQLERPVPDCQQVNVWLARIGWKFAKFSIYISDRGKKWTLIARDQISSPYYKKCAFSGDYGDVSYVKVSYDSSMSWINFILLDAVKAEGGER